MKLFVWNNPISVSYGGTCLYVIAESEEQARQIASNALVSKYGFEPNRDIGCVLPPFDKPLGSPTRIVDAPYAEVYFWEE